MSEQGQLLLLVLGGLGYLLVTFMFYTLAVHYRQAVDIHDRVRDSKKMRHQYLQAMKERSSPPPHA